MEANEEATGVELHKDSKFFASWQKFKDTNPVVNKFVDYRLVVQCLEGAHFFQPTVFGTILDFFSFKLV
jgi:hypothetical protein